METIPEPKLVIYGLKCYCHPEDGVRYVGKTVSGARQRFAEHKSKATRSGEGHDLPVYRWIRSHGVANVYYIILATAIDREGLSRLEVVWIERISALKKLVNVVKVEQGSLRTPHTEATKQKIREKAIGRKRSPESIEKSRLASTGRIVSAETREKIAASKRGKPRPRYSVEKTAAKLRGRTASAETKAKISAAGMGRKHSLETRKKMSAWQMGNGNHRAKLSSRNVAEIIFMLSDGIGAADLAIIYGVSPATVHDIKAGRTWRHMYRPELK